MKLPEPNYIMGIPDKKSCVFRGDEEYATTPNFMYHIDILAMLAMKRKFSSTVQVNVKQLRDKYKEYYNYASKVDFQFRFVH